MKKRRFSREIESLEQIFHFLEEFFAEEGVGPDHRYSISFAVEELFTNTVKYNPGNSNQITIAITREADFVEIEICDSDVDYFDVTGTEAQPIDVPLAQRKVGGLGLQLTRQLMDSVEYSYKDRQSKVRLIKHLR